MLKRILSSVFSPESTTINTPRPGTRRAAMEKLETRVLFHNPFVVRGTADNRGEVQLTLDADSAELSASSFNKNSVQMYEAGPDGILANADDARVAASIRFTPSNQRLLIRGDVPAGNGYRIKIVSSRIPVSPGFAFDGNFNGHFPSGDGAAGGNFEMQVKNDKSTRPTARMYTSEGIINITLFRDLAPKNANNFLTYANSKKYDNFFFSRAEAGFVIQGGGITINNANEVVDNPSNPNVQGEPGVSNTRGRLSLALSAGTSTSAPNQGSNEFFFNLADNSFLDNQQPAGGGLFSGPFTAFGEAKGAADLAILDAIGNKPTVNFATLSPPLSFSGTDTSKVPVNGSVTTTFNPSTNGIVIRRTVLMSRIAAL